MAFFVSVLFIINGCCEHNKSVCNKGSKMKAVPFTDVKIEDKFWAGRIETNRKVTIPVLFKKCEEAGRIDNFAIAGGLKKGEHRGQYPFDDTDVYKAIEAASFSLKVHPDAELEKYIDNIVALIAAAQESDGYLNTARRNKSEVLKGRLGDERWVNENGPGNSHELYNAGHLYEAAVAHYYATGKRNLLNIAIKNADLVCGVFGPGKNETAPGHQVIEMGLVKLYQATGNKKYLNLAKFFLDTRGPGGETYTQSHKKVIDQNEAVGHAVRAGYMYSGMADVAALIGEQSYVAAIDRLWENVVDKKLYVTGGIGADPSIEGFGPAYDLPNMSAYCETCAAIANIYWNQRLFLLHGDAKYVDVLERTLYNGFLSGVSLDGTLFFYPNPLASRGQHERKSWFTCACCPPNIARFLASLPGYVYAESKNGFYVNLFIAGTTTAKIGGKNVQISQRTDYPWNGKVVITVNPQKPTDFHLYIRIPGWAQNKPVPSDLYRFTDKNAEPVSLKVNGKPVTPDIQKGFARINRNWKNGDTVELNLPMPARRLAANDAVTEDRGKVAIQRGPLVYCVEWPDVEGGSVFNLLVPDDAKLKTVFRAGLLNGIETIEGTGFDCKIDGQGKLVRNEKNFLAIPYYAWAHRGKGEMTVWLAGQGSAVEPAGRPSIVQSSEVISSVDSHIPDQIRENAEPVNSADKTKPFFSWLPKKGTTEWIQYNFGKVYEPSIVKVYWVDDGPSGEHRLPKSWKIQYRAGDEWKDVWTPDSWIIEKDKLNKVIFETVRTDSIRLQAVLQDGYSAGLYLWQVK
jgi:uncharacterized protein